jgi:hypothetical protein
LQYSTKKEEMLRANKYYYYSTCNYNCSNNIFKEIVAGISRNFRKETNHDKHLKKAKWNEHRRAGRENHPFYAAAFDSSHIGPYVFTPNRSIAREYQFYQARGIFITTSWANPLGGCGYPINDGLYQR